MNLSKDVEFARLVGFDQLIDASAGEFDFRDDAFGAKIGAKRADVEPTARPSDDSSDAGSA
ncbi:hypothetical protein [Hansschlegelia sp. KR7-227]|uniref:hypothetical protein n=1 Tax=Hansschlegelia sp. KR7-227 TaxID=3400914 RepID=UPI003C11DC08